MYIVFYKNTMKSPNKRTHEYNALYVVYLRSRNRDWVKINYTFQRTAVLRDGGTELGGVIGVKRAVVGC